MHLWTWWITLVSVHTFIHTHTLVHMMLLEINLRHTCVSKARTEFLWEFAWNYTMSHTWCFWCFAMSYNQGMGGGKENEEVLWLLPTKRMFSRAPCMPILAALNHPQHRAFTGLAPGAQWPEPQRALFKHGTMCSSSNKWGSWHPSCWHAGESLPRSECNGKNSTSEPGSRDSKRTGPNCPLKTQSSWWSLRVEMNFLAVIRM